MVFMGIQKRRSRLAAACVVDKAHLPKCIHMGRTNRGSCGLYHRIETSDLQREPANIRKEFHGAAARGESWSKSIGGRYRLGSRLLVFKPQRRVLVVLTVPIRVRRARARRVETHVRQPVRISREFHVGNADVRIHGDEISGSESNRRSAPAQSRPHGPIPERRP